jgi:glyoxylase-like metal-dependent hydrolase (beta-lactamase superfamily II)
MRLRPQPSGWTDPGAHEVVDGVHRIPVPLPLAGLPAVNCYVMEGPDGLVLIDPGWASDEAEQALRAGLAELGHQVEDVAEIAVTHLHWDHYSLANRLKEQLPHVRVGLGRGEAGAFDMVGEGEVFSQRQIRALAEHAAGELGDWAATQPRDEHEVDIPFERPDVWYGEGDAVSLKEGGLTVWETPGHTRGHLVYRLDGAPALFTGDHVLPGATPAIGFEPDVATHALSDYLTSLRRLLDEPELVMLPAHGPVGGSVQDRVRELLAHHEERLDEVETYLASGLATAGDIARAMPWTRRNRHIGDLHPTHQVSATMEVAAHLEVLVTRGRVHKERRADGVVVWQQAAA